MTMLLKDDLDSVDGNILANTAKAGQIEITNSDMGFFQIRALQHSFVLEDACADDSSFVH